MLIDNYKTSVSPNSTNERNTRVDFLGEFLKEMR